MRVVRAHEEAGRLAMTEVLLGSSVLVAVMWLLIAVDTMRGWRRLPQLRDVSLPSGGDEPHVTIVVPARNEERGVTAGVSSLVAQDYPHFDVIAVEDRSTDATRGILEGLAAQHDRLQILPIDTLPDGWLGKNHAMWRGAQAAQGELILFTDADVEMDPCR